MIITKVSTAHMAIMSHVEICNTEDMGLVADFDPNVSIVSDHETLNKPADGGKPISRGGFDEGFYNNTKSLGFSSRLY